MASRPDVERQADGPARWLTLTGVMFASTVAAINMHKVPPIIPVLATELRIEAGDAGALMAVYALAGLVVSVPAAWLLRAVGPRHALAGGGGLTALGAVGGALSDSFWGLLASRFVEGAGLGIVLVVSIVTIAAWFPTAQRGLPIGIFSTWLPLGGLLSAFIAPFVLDRLGWRMVWWIGAALALIGVLLGECLVREAPRSSPLRQVAGTSAGFGWWRQTKVALQSPAFPLAIAFGLFHASRAAFLTWAPTYLVMRGLGLADAAALASLSTVLTIPLCVVAGGLIALLGSPQRVYAIGLLLNAPLQAVAFFVEPAWAVPVLLVVGAIAALVPTAINLVAPDARPRGGSPGVAVATVAFGRNGGMLLGPFIAGAALQFSDFNWAIVAFGIAGASLLGGLLGLFGPVSTGDHATSSLAVGSEG